VTPSARSSGAAQFELRRFEATPVTGAIVLVELEGRFRQSTRFGRPPVLVIDPGEDRRRVELQPVRTSADGQRWQASYAVPAEALTATARLALGIRGTLLELPAPDEPDDGQRLTALAREANTLRRELEAAEAGAAERIAALEQEVAEAHRLAASAAETARAESAAALALAEQRATAAETSLTETTTRAESAEQRATEIAARAESAEQRATEATARAEAAERSSIESTARAESAEQRATEATARAEAAERSSIESTARAESAEQRATEATARAEAAERSSIESTARAESAEQRATEATARAETAERSSIESTARADVAEQRADVAEQRAIELEESLRVAQAAEQRAIELEESLRVAEAAVSEAQEQTTAEVDAPLTAEMASAVDAEARAVEAERELRVAREGIAVLRSELAEERERSQATIAELSDARSYDTAAPTTVAPRADEDETRVLRSSSANGGTRDAAADTDPTEAFSVTDEADATAEKPVEPLERKPLPHAQHTGGGASQLGRWIAVGALILFAIVLIALLFGL
jgi:hypothetical protein